MTKVCAGCEREVDVTTDDHIEMTVSVSQSWNVGHTETTIVLCAACAYPNPGALAGRAKVAIVNYLQGRKGR